MKCRPPSFHASAQHRQLELTLTDADERERRPVRFFENVARESQREGLHAREGPDHGQARGEPVAHSRLESLTHTHEVRVDTDRAGVEEETAVHETDVDTLDARRLRAGTRGFQVRGDAVIARKMIEGARRDHDQLHVGPRDGRRGGGDRAIAAYRGDAPSSLLHCVRHRLCDLIRCDASDVEAPGAPKSAVHLIGIPGGRIDEGGNHGAAIEQVSCLGTVLLGRAMRVLSVLGALRAGQRAHPAES